jgi:hypothetical protein
MNKKIKYLFRYWFYSLSTLFVKLYIRPKFNLVIEKGSDPIPNPPFILVSNHSTFFDPWIVGHYSRHPLSIMMNDEGLRSNAFVQWYLRNIGTIPKKKGTSDYRAMKTALKMLGKGFPLLIFPEGQTSWDGETQPIFPGVEKIVKWSNCSLVMTKVKGNFLSKPWWAESYRKGKVRIFRKVLNPNEIKSFTENELLHILIEYIYQNDIKDEENQQIKFTGKNLTKGLEYFLWICKNCRNEDALVTNGNTVSCSRCGSAWSMDTHFQFKEIQSQTQPIGDLYDWSLWHKEIVRKKITETSDREILTQSENVIYCKTTEKGKIITVSEGKLILTKDVLTFHSETDKTYSLQLPVKDIKEYVFQRKNIFECVCNDTSYRFRFYSHSPMKWVFYFRYLHGYEKCEQRGFL